MRPEEATDQRARLTYGIVNESDDKNKSAMEVPPDYGEKKGIPAGRPGREEDMAQAALFLACNEYAYGQVSAIVYSCSIVGVSSPVPYRLWPLKVATSSSTRRVNHIPLQSVSI